jgi:hypothetical protein
VACGTALVGRLYGERGVSGAQSCVKISDIVAFPPGGIRNLVPAKIQKSESLTIKRHEDHKEWSATIHFIPDISCSVFTIESLLDSKRRI